MNDGMRLRVQLKDRWYAYLGGNPGDDVRDTIAFTLPEGKQPNWFHRWMQYLMLGIYWRLEEDDEDPR